MIPNQASSRREPHRIATATAARNELRWLKIVALVLFAIKLAFILFAGPSSDEAYYWLWGQHPDLSYFDHPPFHSWLLGISDAVFGRSLLSLRWLTIATALGTFWIFRVWAQRFAGANWEIVWWRSVAIYLASPLFLLFFSVAFHDYLLGFLCLLSAHFFLLFLADTAEAKRAKLWHLYLGAIVLGFAGLTKYAAGFVGLGLALTILSYRPLRPLLRSIHLYLAAGFCVVMQAPVLIWNVRQGGASFRFHLVGRHANDWLAHPSLARVFEFPLASMLLLSPLLIPVFFRFFWHQPPTAFERVGQRWAVWIFWITSGLFLLYSLYDYVNFWWNIPAYLLVLPFAGKYLGGRLLVGHLAYGLAASLFILFNYVVVPVPTVSGNNDFRLSQLYGWEVLEPTIRPLQQQYKPDFIASDYAEIANIVAFALDHPEVTSLTPLINQFDYWFEPEAHRGQTALLVLDTAESTDFLRSQFNSFEPVAEVPVVRLGYRVRTFRFFIGRGYAPSPEQPAN